MGRICLFAAILLCGVMDSVCLNAQIVENLVFIDENENGGLEYLAEYLQRLAEQPVKINCSSRGELKELFLLSDFQIESIMDYRNKSGDILSASQLALLHGFDDKTAERLKPFISFEPGGNSLNVYSDSDTSGWVRSLLKGSDSQLFVKAVYGVEKKETPALLARYKWSHGNKLQIGFTLESDEGEGFFRKGLQPTDFTSFHIAVKNRGRLNSLVLGDYAVRFGQGLTIWRSFSLGGVSTPMALNRRGAAIVPYTSASESNFCRGAAASLSFGNLDVNAFISANGLDEDVKDDGMGGIMAGANISYMFRRLKLGGSYVAYEYNGVAYGNAAMDFYTIIERIKLFGEFAIDYSGSCAAVLGTVFNISDKIETGMLLRSYSTDYVAPYAGAYSTISSVSNQAGVTINNIYSISERWKLLFGTDMAYYPGERYNIDEHSAMLKFYVAGEYAYGRLNIVSKIWNSYTTNNQLNRINTKLQATIELMSGLKIKLHTSNVTAIWQADRTNNAATAAGERRLVDFGWQAGANIRYEGADGDIVLQTGGSLFTARLWNSRLYVYEPDLPYTFNSRLFYGRGCSLYMLFGAQILTDVELYLKLQTLQYMTDSRNPQSHIKFAARMRF